MSDQAVADAVADRLLLYRLWVVKQITVTPCDVMAYLLYH